MSDTRARDHFDSEDELNEVIEAAEEYAHHGEEANFVDEVTKRIQKYGGAAYLSEAQADWLKRIAARKQR